VFTNINSKCVVKLQSSSDDAGFDGLFYYNQFLSTRATLGTTLLDSMYFNISHNIFDNPLSPLLPSGVKNTPKIAIFRICYGENGTVKFVETLADNVFRHHYSMMQI
jgi:hypothetical protein